MAAGGWNGSSGANAPKAVEPKAPSKVRGVVALLAVVIVICGGVAVWLFMHPEPKKAPVVSKKEPTKISEVRPMSSPVTNAVEALPKKLDPNARPTKVGEIVNGYIKLPSGRIHRIKGEYTNTTSVAKAAYAIFDHSCDNQIAMYLSIEPGTALVGTPHYNGRFTKEFLESLKQPLVPPPEATDEQRALYDAVRAAKIELKAAYDRGEDIEKIMLDTRRELQEMGRYKMTLEQQVRETLRSGEIDVQGVEDVVKAANQMLEAKGIAPIDFGPVAKKRLERYVEASILKNSKKTE